MNTLKRCNTCFVYKYNTFFVSKNLLLTPRIAHYSSLVKPLWEMLQEGQFQWNSVNEQNFYKICNLLCKNNLLSFFDPDKPNVIQTDASKLGLGAVLLQNDIPVMFVSRTLTDTESRYSQIELEFLAIVFGLTKLRKYF